MISEAASCAQTGDKQEAAGGEAAEGTVVDDDINAEDDEAPEEDALAAPAAAPQPAPALLSPRKVPASAIAWAGAAIQTTGGNTFYRCAARFLCSCSAQGTPV